MSPLQRLEQLTEYENKLYEKADKEYEGGIDKYEKDGPKSLQYLEDMKKQQYAYANSEIQSKYDKSTLYHAYNGMKQFLTLEGSAPPLEALMVRLGQGVYKVPALAARAGGFDEAADKLEKWSTMVRKDYKIIGDTLGVLASKDPTNVSDLVFKFFSGFFSYLEPRDKDAIMQIAKADGLLKDDGTIAEQAWYHPDYLAKSMGHFARQQVMMKGLFGAERLAGMSNLAYAGAYGISAALSDAIGVKSNESLLPRMGKIAFWTSAGLASGMGLSSWIGRNPMFASFLSKIPAGVQEFILSRTADIGESLADAVMLSFQPGQNKWDIIKNFPVAVVANWLEEIAVDFMGGKTNKGMLVQHQLHDLRMMQVAETNVKANLVAELERLNMAKMDDGRRKELIAKTQGNIDRVDATINKLREAYVNRTASLKGAFKAEEPMVKQAIENDREIYDLVVETSKAQGMNQMEAVEEAIATVVSRQVEASVRPEFVKQADENIRKVVDANVDATVKTVETEENVLAEYEQMARDKEQASPKTIVEKDIQKISTISKGDKWNKAAFEEAGYDVDIMIQNHPSLRFVFSKDKGGSPDMVAERLLSEGKIDVRGDEGPSEALARTLEGIEIARKSGVIQGSITEEDEAEYQRDKAIEAALTRGDLTQDEVDAFYSVDIADRPMTGGGFVALKSWIKRQPKAVQDVLQVNEEGDIQVDPAKFEKAYGRPYKGEKGTGRFYTVNGRAFIDLVYGATPSTAYHEIFHFVQKMALTEGEQTILNNEVGNLEKQADAFSQYVLNRPTEGRITAIFRKISEFLQSVRNWFEGNGFTNVNQIFNQAFVGGSRLVEVSEQLGTLVRAAPPMKSFLTPEGEKRLSGSHMAEFPDAAKMNWIKVNAVNGTSYSMAELNDENIRLIEDDINKRDIDDEIIVETPDVSYIIPRGVYDGSLRSSLARAWKYDNKTDVDEMYAYESEPEKVAEIARNDVKPSKIWSLLKEMGKVGDMIPYIRTLRRKYTKDVAGDIGVMQRYFDMPSFVGDKYPQIKAMIDAYDRRSRLSVRLAGEFSKTLEPYDRLKGEDLAAVDKLLTELDTLGRSLTTDEIEALNISKEAKAGYVAVRKVMAEVRADIIARLHNEYNYQAEKLNNPNLSEGVKERLKGALNRIKKEIKQVSAWAGKGYMPHTWYGDHHVITDIGGNFIGREKEIIAALDRIDELRGKKGELSGQFKAQFTPLKAVHLRIPFIKDTKGIFDKSVDILKELGLFVNTENVGRDNNAFESVRRDELMVLMDRLFEEARKGEDDKAIVAAIDKIEKEYDIMEKAQGWRRHWLNRSDTLGYEMMSVRAVLAQYVQGYAGLVGKAQFGRESIEIMETIPAESRLRGYAKDLYTQMMHQADEVDKVINHMTSFIYAKHLAFNMVYHVRNRMQPWYMGVPVMMEHGIGAKQAAKEMLRAQRDLFLIEMVFTKAIPAYKGELIAKEIHGTNKDEMAAVIEFVADKGVGGMSAEVFSKAIADDPHRKAMGTLRKLYDTYLRAAGKFVQMSDSKNRLQVFLAAYRSLKKEGIKEGEYDRDAYEKARKISEEANVNYAGWNIPPVFMAGSRGRIAKPLFMFHKYGWHITRKQMRWIAEGQWGPMAAMYLITAALGGAGTLPFWDELKKILGVESSMDLRKSFVDYMGGESTLVDMLEHGVFGLAGVDITRSMQIRPIAFIDPLMGNNAILGFFDGFGRFKDDILRGRAMKAIMEGPASQGWLMKLHRSYRNATEGVTSFRGDPTLDIDGRPLTLTPTELTLSAMGFMPLRLAKHYRSEGAIKDLISHYGLRKSRIATRYKISQLKGDTDGMRQAMMASEEFNRDVADIEKASGKSPSTDITQDTLNRWGKHEENERLTTLMRYYYGDK